MRAVMHITCARVHIDAQTRAIAHMRARRHSSAYPWNMHDARLHRPTRESPSPPPPSCSSLMVFLDHSTAIQIAPA
eukprot:SAG31_NODE_14095_length_827_cov_1.989011_1_plen_76_part_00